MSILSYTHQGQSSEAQADSLSSGAEPGSSETSPPQKKSAMAMVFADFYKTAQVPVEITIHILLFFGQINEKHVIINVFSLAVSKSHLAFTQRWSQ